MTTNLEQELRHDTSVLEAALKLLAWLSAAIGLIKLSRDLDLVELSLIFQDLISAYKMIIRPFFDFLFGWIKVPWLKISDLEADLIIIMSIPLLAISRATATVATFKRFHRFDESTKKWRKIESFSSARYQLELSQAYIFYPTLMLTALCVYFLLIPAASPTTPDGAWGVRILFATLPIIILWFISVLFIIDERALQAFAKNCAGIAIFYFIFLSINTAILNLSLQT